MTAGRYNLLIEQGATYRLPLRYRDAAGAPVLFDNMKGVLTLFNVDGTTALEITSPEGVELNTDGQVIVTLTATQTAALSDDGGKYHFDLHNGTIVDRVIAGTWGLV
jgi:hypothetical protein